MACISQRKLNYSLGSNQYSHDLDKERIPIYESGSHIFSVPFEIGLKYSIRGIFKEKINYSDLIFPIHHSSIIRY